MHTHTDVSNRTGSSVGHAARNVVASFESKSVTREDLLSWTGRPAHGRVLAVTGHRPDKIGGYDETHPMRRAVRAAIRSVLQGMKGSFVGVTGMALGVDQDFAEECISLDVPFVAAVPFRGQENVWRGGARRRYDDLLAQAACVVYVCPPPYAGWKLQQRNEWMVDRSDELLAIFDGSSGGTQNCVLYASRPKMPNFVNILVLSPEQCLKRFGEPREGAAVGTEQRVPC